ncbi:MAG: dTDP-4-dehydrorhamnose reductase [Acidobacteriota bacterium]
MRVLVTGCRGQLGRALAAALPAAGHEFIGVDLPELDITDAETVRLRVAAARPEVIVNCAAFTAVDAAETAEAAALAVNGTAVETLADACERVGSRLVQISTDYVFDGTATRAYRESDLPGPLSAYGRTKLAGERAAARASRHLIVRTAWLFGQGANFVAAIRRQLDAGARQLRVVSDQFGCPTYAADLAAALVQLLVIEAHGTVHVVNEGSTSWFGLAREIVRQTGALAEVVPISTAQASRPAARPARSILDTARLRELLGHGLPAWQDALGRYLCGGGRCTDPAAAP